MNSVVFLALATWCLTSCRADINVSDYIFWKKADINAWHEYFPSRALEEERQTLVGTVEAINKLSSGLNASLSSVVAFQAQELATATMLMADTDAEGCVNGISDYMDKAIQDEIEEYNNCAADALSKVSRLNKTWSSVKTNYLTAYNRALSGIDACAKTYPNKNSIDRLKSCVESMNTNYFKAANITQNNLFPSPTMSYFQKSVVGCASNAATTVAAKGSQFLKMLMECAVLSGNIDIEAYKQQLGQWKGYNDTLATQITDAQDKNYYQVFAVEKEMQSYYSLQKQALERYVIESRGLSTYLNAIYSFLSNYYNTVTATSLDNPADYDCTASAKAALDAVANASAAQSLSCDLDIVNTTKKLFGEVNNNFLYLNKLMPSTGNAALLKCIAEGYVFAPNTIEDCFDLVYNEFDVTYEDNQTVIIKDVGTLSFYMATFFEGSNLPCGSSSLKRVYLGADVALYNLQRCLYKKSGTTYSITTPYKTETTTPTYSAYA